MRTGKCWYLHGCSELYNTSSIESPYFHLPLLGFDSMDFFLSLFPLFGDGGNGRGTGVSGLAGGYRAPLFEL